MKENHRIYILLSFIALFLYQTATDSVIAEIIRGPYLSDATRTTIVVSWETE